MIAAPEKRLPAARRIQIRPGALGLNLLTYAFGVFFFFPFLWRVLTVF
jgi:hypothetical protein